MLEFKLESSWRNLLEKEFSLPYMLELKDFLNKELKAKKTIYPAATEIFQALDKTAFNKVKVVILGQDPYHGEDQAHGMSFSVKRKIKIPPSLRNIYKELQADIAIAPPKHGHLESWASQGVLLLNTVLTVEKGRAGSHRKKGWEVFTDKIIKALSDKRENIVFILWGAPAQKKIDIIDSSKHLILTAPHPSPLSSYRGFFGCKHFSKANDYLTSNQLNRINWEID